MTPIRHRALVFDARLSAGNTANDTLVTGNTRSFFRSMCLCVKRRNVKPDSKHRSLPDSALFHADNRTEQKTILPFSLNIAAFRCPTLPDRCSFRNFGLNLFYEHLSIAPASFFQMTAFDLQALFVGLDHLLDHLAADRAGLAAGQVAVVALLEVDTDLPWCSFSILKLHPSAKHPGRHAGFCLTSASPSSVEAETPPFLPHGASRGSSRSAPPFRSPIKR